MTQGMDAAITRVQAIIAGVSGVLQAPADPPDSISRYPFAVAYAGESTWTLAPAGMAQNIGTIVVELHVLPRDKGLALAVSKAMGFHDAIPRAILADPTLAGTVANILVSGQGAPITCDGIQLMGWDAVETIGLRWRVRVKIERAL